MLTPSDFVVKKADVLEGIVGKHGDLPTFFRLEFAPMVLQYFGPKESYILRVSDFELADLQAIMGVDQLRPKCTSHACKLARKPGICIHQLQISSHGIVSSTPVYL